MEPASFLTHGNFFSSGSGGGIDLGIIWAKFCSSSRKLNMEWQLSTQNQVFHNLQHLLMTEPKLGGPVTSLSPLGKGTLHSVVL